MFNLAKIIGGWINIRGNSDGTVIGNAADALKVNMRNAAGDEVGTPADPLFVEFPENADRTPVEAYDEALAVPTGVTTEIVSYTVPATKEIVLERVEASGENIAVYTILVNSVVIATQRSFWGEINAKFDFLSKASLGKVLVAGDIITVEVLHNRPSVGNFEARIQMTMLN